MAELNQRDVKMQDAELIAKKAGEDAAELIVKNRDTVLEHDKRLADLEKDAGKSWLDTSAGQTFQEKWAADYKALQDEMKAQNEELKAVKAAKDTLEAMMVNLSRAPASLKDQETLRLKKLEELYEKNLWRLGQSAVGIPVEGDVILDENAEKAYREGVMENKSAKEKNEIKTMQVSTYGRAGVLMMPTEISKKILDNAVQDISNIAQYCTVYTTSAESLMLPKTTAHGVAGWLGQEGATRTADTTLTFGSTTITLHWCYARYAIGIRMLRYGDFPLRQIMAREYRDGLSKIWGTAQFNGSGTQEPEGIMVNADVGSRNQGEAATLTNADAIIKLFTDFKPLYRPNLMSVFNRATEGILLTIKDGVGRYLLREFGETGEFRLRGKPVHLAEDMPDVGAGLYPIVVGDFKRGCTVLLPKQSSIQLEDKYTNATTGIVNYQITTTKGFGVTVAEVIKKLCIAA